MICLKCGVDKESTLASIKKLLKERDELSEKLLMSHRPETETKIDGPCTEGDGCPTEIAVLKREWRQLKAENSALGVRVKQLAEWKEKAKVWLASPEAAAQLDGYRELGAKAAALEKENDRLREALEAIHTLRYLLGECYAKLKKFGIENSDPYLMDEVKLVLTTDIAS